VPWRRNALLACDLDEAQKQALCAAIENLKDEHAAGGTPTAVRIPQPDGVNKPVEFSFFIPQQYGSAHFNAVPHYSELLEDYYATKDPRRAVEAEEPRAVQSGA